MNWKLFSTAVFTVGLVTGCGTTSNSPTAESTTSTYSSLATSPDSGSQSVCDADRVQGAVGQNADDRLAERSRSQAGAKIVRVLKPDSVMTTEYNPERLNLLLDEQGVVSRVNCG
jgi:hypothetical protein